MMNVTLRVKRYDPDLSDESYWAEYVVAVAPTDTVLTALQEVKDHHDGTLALRRACNHGICGSDALLINGINRLACKTLVCNLGDEISVEPLAELPVLRDLISDMGSFFEQYRAIKPYLIADDDPPNRERRQSPDDRRQFNSATKCILCAACHSSCPSFRFRSAFVGPAALVQASRFIYDSRDAATNERLEALDKPDGAWGCQAFLGCTMACPRGIPVSRRIAEIKQQLRLQWMP